MFLARIAVQRPVLATMVVGAFVVLGLFSYQRLVIDLFPRVEFPMITVTTIYPGAGPEEVETQVTEKIEDVVSTISDIKYIRSTCRENVSVVVIEFELEKSPDIAAMEVKDKVDSIRRDLPEDAEDPVIVKFDVNAMPIMNLAVSAPRDLKEIYYTTDKVIKNRLSSIHGVASVEIIGGQEREIQVIVNRFKADAYRVSLLHILAAISSENLTVPVGHITQDYWETTVRMVGEFKTLEEIRRLPLPLEGDTEIFLQDVAEIRDAYKEQRELAWFQAKPCVSMVIQKRSDANTVEVAHGVSQVLEELEALLPDYRIEAARNRSLFIVDSVQDVVQNMALGILLTSLLLFLFLQSVRATIVAAVAMPTSVVATFLLIDFAGFTLNMVSLLGLGICIGILVTNSIVVLENIIRYRDQGLRPDQAAIKGTSEIALAVAASTLPNIVVFTPIAFMGGMVGQFFKQFGLTVVFATIFSLLVSFTLVPLLSSRLLREKQARSKPKVGRATPVDYIARVWEWLYRNLEKVYRGALDWCLHYRGLVILGVIALFFASLQLFRFVGGEFVPLVDQGLLTVNIEMPPGTSLWGTDRISREVADIIQEEPDVKSVLVQIGGEQRGVETAELVVQLVDRDQRLRSLSKFINDLRPPLAVLPAAEITVKPVREGPEGDADIEIEVLGPDLEEVNRLAREVMLRVQKQEGLVDIRTSWRKGKPEQTFVPDRKELARYGISSSLIAGFLRTGFEGEVASSYREGGDEYDIRVRYRESDRVRRDALEQVRIPWGPAFIPLNQLGEIQERLGKSKFLRKDRLRMTKVTANIGEGNLTGQVQALQDRFKDIRLEAGHSIHFSGQAEEQRENFAYIYQALLIAIILTYMVLAAIMESFIHPFTILVTLPLGLIGVALSLFFTGETINVFSMMAIIMLVGIVVNNAILLLNYTEEKRAEGLELMEALREACPVRLRPIVMSNLAIAVGMLPQAMGGAGSEFRASMAIVTIGGVIVSAVFTLLVIPVIYSLLDKFSSKSYS